MGSRHLRKKQYPLVINLVHDEETEHGLRLVAEHFRLLVKPVPDDLSKLDEILAKE